jgi:hypothetical protein
MRPIDIVKFSELSPRGKRRDFRTPILPRTRIVLPSYGSLAFPPLTHSHPHPLVSTKAVVKSTKDNYSGQASYVCIDSALLKIKIIS